jgi:peptide/nickel transport system substrate-binding protein
MEIRRWMLLLSVVAAIASLSFTLSPAGAETPKLGGILKFLVPEDFAGMDGHRENTFVLIHPIAPFYSTLIRVNPDDPTSNQLVCDLCTGKPERADGGKTYTFKIRKDVKFHDGTTLTAKDVLATFQRIIFPPKGVQSARVAQFTMVDSVTSPDDETVVFKLKYPSGAFILLLANPFNFIYSKAKLDADQHWYEKNVMGSGPFIFEERQVGAFVKGKRNPHYHHPGKPYLDGFEAIIAKTQMLRLQAIRGGQAAADFRGIPPMSRDVLVGALGKDLTVQESDWNCAQIVTPNQRKKPFDDVRVRRALTLALDRWQGSREMSKITIVKAVGGIVFPGHPLATPKEELEKLAGYWADIDKSRAEARRLLKEAGVSNLKFTLHSRAIDQPYTIVGTWLIDQWKQVGIAVDQSPMADGPYFAAMQQGQFDVALEFYCGAVVNPLVDVAKFRPDAGDQYGAFKDGELVKLHTAMNKTGDVAEQRNLMQAFERRVLDEGAYSSVLMWWYRIVAHRSFVQGWKIQPSTYVNQDLSTVWLDN